MASIDFNRLRLDEDDAKLWHRRLDAAARKREDEYEPDAFKFIDRYNGNWWDEAERDATTADLIAANLAHADVRILRSIILNRKPIVRVEAEHPDFEEREVLVEQVMNTTWKNIDVKAELERGSLDAIVTGHGWVKCGYQAEFQQVPKKKKVKDEDGADREVEAGTIGQDEDEEFIRQESVYAVRVSPFEVLVDPAATTMANARWIAQEKYRPVGDVMVDERYDPATRKKVVATSRLPDRYRLDDNAVHGDEVGQTVDEAEYVRELHVWDRRRGMYCVTAEGLDEDWLLSEPMEDKWISNTELPWTRVWFTDSPDRFWCISDLAMAEDLEVDLNKTMSLQLAAAKRAARIFLVSPAMDALQREKLQNAEDGEIIEGTPEQISLLDTPSINSDVFSGVQVTMNQIREVRGVNEYLRGGAPSAVSTATEAGIIDYASQLSNAPRRDRIEVAAADITTKLWKLIVAHYETEHVIKLVGESAVKTWETWTGEDLDGEYRLFVEVGSSQPQARAQNIQERMTVYQVMAQSQVAPDIDQEKLMRWMLEAFDVNLDSFMMPEQMREQMAQQQAQQAEMAAMAGAEGGGDQSGGMPPSGLQGTIPNAAAPPTGTSEASREGA